MRTLLFILKEHFVWRGQILLLAKADIIKTYSGAALGWLWALVKPLVTIFVFWFAFTYGVRAGGDVNGYPFALWMIPGFMAWFYMSEMLRKGTDAIRRYRFLVTKMKFPVSTIPTFVSLAHLAIHFVLMVIVAIIFVATGHMPSIYWLQIFIYMLLMFVFWSFWGLFASLLGSMSKDFINLVRALNTAIFWMSGIMYDVNSIPNATIQNIMYFNPVTYIATGYRNCFIYHRWIWEEPEQLLIFFGMLIVMIILAIWSYRKLIKEIPDVL